MKIKKGDNVIVTTGKDRGKIGKVDRILTMENRIVVKGINIIKKHQKKTQAKPQGGIIEKYAPIALSKVQILCPSCNKPTRVGYLIVKNQKSRICRQCKSSLDEVTIDSDSDNKK